MKNIKNVLITILLVLLTFTCNIYSVKAMTDDNIDNDYESIDILEEDSIDISLDEVNISIPLKVSARNAIAIDAESNQVLWNQNAYEIVPMASTTKILTALIAINYGDLDRKVIISKNASSIRGSTVGYSAGEEITMRELLFGLMFRSGNDAAIAIAEDIGGSIEGFSNIMNDFAKNVGIIDSHFESPHGLDSSKHYSSAYDLAILTSKAMEYSVFRECVGEKVIYKDKYNFTRDYQNINKILYKIPEANGVKTGYTGGAGKCLVSSINHNGKNIIIVVLNCVDRWNVTEKIYNYVVKSNEFINKNNKTILQEEKLAGLGKIINEEDLSYGYKESDIVEVEVFKPILDIEVGNILGKISVKDTGKEKNKFPLISNININKEELEKIILGEK
ncbi:MULTISPECIES: D-alanyl-D-alanine carboxypeptidase family protein [unclassified Clostridium]|uniref:D-alanyl-D-alanine carboxypeptidase family protein n=1 Tax=unclassified Clostridium TaxID=2614128 RepID=UPI0025C58211|nr:D-alanyl-D-alanine carboxypeptidase family protein [Clostridium sp.]MCI6693011.1 D-alanyl-D-alanine carboxypeptidase [Clostridium sp.]MDY2630214.1 D-alanyl-D-alanine carboxypeptidase family protein [Clostridium sp.]MDY4251775.1 D-alanyl-D-alanine carboxypeptidase family protein [Clostridium sp.]MDY6228388.1 D-alanyl-D-alanine carboxypeptidase family protein [Clostridium sp.]